MATTTPAASAAGTDVDTALVKRAPARKTTTRKPAAPKAPVVEAPKVEQAPAKKVRPADIPVDGCSSLVSGVKLNCEHTTYASDPHCRRRDCANDIRQCTVHVLGKGGVVTVVASA